MNRIVLIGNGFDLAHKLKTKYEDFLDWYWLNWGEKLLYSQKKKETDGLCSFEIKNNVIAENWAAVFRNYNIDTPFISTIWKNVINRAKEDNELCDFWVSPFLQQICNSVETKKWVDIENEYFSLLTEEKIFVDGGHYRPDYKMLNLQLDVLRYKLVQYLESESKKEVLVYNEIANKIYCPITVQEISVAYEGAAFVENKEPSAIMLLNFNYTNTPEQYITNPAKVKINYIHGKLDDPQSVIFGYGDELDAGFKKLQNMNNNECLRQIKSIRYLESENYKKMLKFIDVGPFQIYIMGHSCGNSDRTLLNTLLKSNYTWKSISYN